MAGWIKAGDRSHPHLKLIDDELMHRLTYSGYADDLHELERAHLTGDKFDLDHAMPKLESHKNCLQVIVLILTLLNSMLSECI